MNLELFLNNNRYDTKALHFATSQEDYDCFVNLFHKYNLTNEQLNQNQWQVLEDLILTKQMIEEKLQPLRKVCRYQLNVVGGCLRDLLLNKTEQMNAYDIIICRSHSINENDLKSLANSLGIQVNINSEEFNAIKSFRLSSKKEQYKAKNIEWDTQSEKYFGDNAREEYYFSKIVQHLVKDLPSLEHFSTQDVEKKYANYHIMSINQFIGHNGKKVDLIVSDYCQMGFLSTFDIELCKAYIDLHEVKTKEDMMEKLVVTGSMLQDIENKTLSINAIKFPEDNLSYFFNKHLVKLMEKFPDYQVNLIHKKPIEQFTIEEKNRWIYAQHLKMNYMFPEKDNNVKRRKI